MTKTFNNLAEIKKYYVEETNTYVFKEDGRYIYLIIFSFDLEIDANINANNIYAYDIKANDIDVLNINAFCIKANNIYANDINVCDIDAGYLEANDINARNINATYISYSAVCYAYGDIVCNSIKSDRKNAKHFVLDGKLEVRGNENGRLYKRKSYRLC